MEVYRKSFISSILFLLWFGILPLCFVAYKLISGKSLEYMDWNFLVVGILTTTGFIYEKSVPYISITESKIIKKDFFTKWEIEFDKIDSAIVKSGWYIFKSPDKTLRFSNKQIPEDTLSKMEVLLERKLRALSPLTDH